MLDEPATLLDAARQAGVLLRADCGGKGLCGKCKVQLLGSSQNYPPTKPDQDHIEAPALLNGFRLACETVTQGNLKVYIPQDSAIEGQVLQVESRQRETAFSPAVKIFRISLQPAHLNDLRSDFLRVRDALGDVSCTAKLELLRVISVILRANNWCMDVIMHGKEIIHATGPADNKLLGLAVDVGSTKLACYLMDLETGETLATRGVPNPQIAYGEDIMARIAYAQNSAVKSKLLQSVLMDAVNASAGMLANDIGAKTSQIADICLVGNTAMHHLFLNLPIENLAVSPFVPVLSDPASPSAVEIGLEAMPGCRIYAPPVIAGFVGSDHLAFLLAENFGGDEQIRLGIDIGTNTEIALQKGIEIVSVSTASGPAFEGAHIRFGMRAAPGAIEHVQLNQEGQAEIQVIGGKPPIGICGSGILDAIAEMRRIGMLNERGRMVKDFPGVEIAEDGKPIIKLSNEKNPINLSQTDVDQILLAKGAIRAGIDVLMDHLNVSPEEIDEVVIAGAFGTFMLPEQAMRIGMLPQIPLEKIHTVGNAAGAGARMMLISKTSREKAEALAKRIRYLELTVYPEFPLFYARGIQA